MQLCILSVIIYITPDSMLHFVSVFRDSYDTGSYGCSDPHTHSEFEAGAF